jgi:molecular chaperone HtpG
MTSTAILQDFEGRMSCDPDDVRIGKDVIELLTSGMYVSPVTVYREYIQNAADAIDAARAEGLLREGEQGLVSIALDHQARSAVIRDNGIGVAPNQAARVLLAIGGSRKRGTSARGFRGVGRLSGLAYCRELAFRTKTAGSDVVTTVTWDCRALRERLGSASFGGDLKRIVADVTSLSHEKATDGNDRFFEVRMKDIPRLRNDVLLNEQIVGHYLAQVGPVPFSPAFSAAKEIEARLAQTGRQAPISLTVGQEQIFRPFADELTVHGATQKLYLRDIECIEFADVDGGVGAFCWIAHHDYLRSLPAALGIRGLRARSGDLQVGEPHLFDEIFKEPRFNGWSVGEIHVLDRRIVPNARRDNFEVNHHYYNLLVQLGGVAAKITQRCRSASVSRNAAQIVQNVIAEAETRLKQKRPFDKAELSRLKSAVLRAGPKAKRIEDEALRKRLIAKLERVEAALAARAPKRGASVVAFDEASALVSKFVTNREQARKLVEALRKLCN